MFDKWQEVSLKAQSYVLASMNLELQSHHENMKSTNEILLALQEFFNMNYVEPYLE